MKDYEYWKRMAFPVVKNGNRFYLIVYPNCVTVLTQHINYDRALIPLEKVYEVGYIGRYKGKQDVFSVYNLGHQTDKLIAERNWESNQRACIDIEKICAEEDFASRLGEDGKIKDVEWELEDDEESGFVSVDKLLEICENLGIKTHNKPHRETLLSYNISTLKSIQENKDCSPSDESEGQ